MFRCHSCLLGLRFGFCACSGLSLRNSHRRLASFWFKISFFFSFPTSVRTVLLIAEIDCRCLTDGKSRHSHEKYLQADDFFIESREGSEGTEMVFIAQAFDHFIPFRLRRFCLPQTVRAHQSDQVVFGRSILFHRLVLLAFWVVGCGVGVRATLRVCGSLRASPVARRACRWHSPPCRLSGPSMPFGPPA